MPDLLVRDLDQAVVDRLKKIAQDHGRSLQKEVKVLLERASEALSMAEARAVSERWIESFGDQVMSDSAELVREDRER